MGDENPIHTLRDYSKLSHEGYKNTIKLPVGNNMVPLRSDTIQLVQNGCSFHGLWSEDPNQHLKDFLKLVDSLDLDGENREMIALHLFSIFPSSIKLAIGSIVSCREPSPHGRILLPKFLASILPPEKKGRKTPQKYPDVPQHQWSHDTQYCLKTPEQLFVDTQSSRTDEAGDARLSKFEANFKRQQGEMTNNTVKNPKLGKNGSAFVQGEIPAKIEDPGLFTLPCRLGDSKPFNTLVDVGSCVNIIPLYLFKKLYIGTKKLEEDWSISFGLADGTKSYPVRIVKDVEVHIGKLKLLNDFYVIDIKKDHETPLLVGRGFLATANAVIDCRMAKIVVGEGIGVKGVDIGEEEAPYWTTLGKRESYKP
ncbi:MAK10-like protein [Tanacetum coccineum]